MSHPYDASTKYLVEARLRDWLPLSGQSATGPVEIVDADLATVTAAADRVLRVHDDPPWLLHVELQSSRDPDLLANLAAYNVLLHRRHRALVQTLVVLLRPSADAPDLTGVLELEFGGRQPYLTFRYQVVRVWQMAAETLLSGGLGIVPLAPLGAVSEGDLPGVIRRMSGRIGREATSEEAATLWTAAAVLMGLRYPPSLVVSLLKGVHGMRESVTYQMIVDEGKVQNAQEFLLRLGRKRFGPPSPATETAVRGITDIDRLTDLHDRALDASSWDDLLAVA